jgi:hypothetical protein
MVVKPVTAIGVLCGVRHVGHVRHVGPSPFLFAYRTKRIFDYVSPKPQAPEDTLDFHGSLKLNIAQIH